MKIDKTNSSGAHLSDAEHALVLLLRSPRLSISTIMELLEIGDLEFRRLSQENEQIAQLLAARREGTLVPRQSQDVERCQGCDELYVPYAGRKVCSDTCAKICLVQATGRGRSRAKA